MFHQNSTVGMRSSHWVVRTPNCVDVNLSLIPYVYTFTEVGLGQSCPRTEACNTDNAECASGTCICVSGFYENGDVCRQGQLIKMYWTFCFSNDIEALPHNGMHYLPYLIRNAVKRHNINNDTIVSKVCSEQFSEIDENMAFIYLPSRVKLYHL